MTWIEQQPADKVETALRSYRADDTLLMRECKKDANGNDRFGLWLAVVSAVLIKRVGLTYRDLADWHWHDAYSDGMSPREAAAQALAADDTYSMLSAP